jgi:hypothetical protein
MPSKSHDDASDILYESRRRRQIQISGPLERTADRLAAQHGVSAPTIKRDGQFAAAVETLRPHVPDIEQRVMSGDVPSKAAVVEAAREPEKAEEILGKAHVSHNSGNNEWYTPAIVASGELSTRWRAENRSVAEREKPYVAEELRRKHDATVLASWPTMSRFKRLGRHSSSRTRTGEKCLIGLL